MFSRLLFLTYNERGDSFLEIAIVLPIFLVISLAILWFGITLHSVMAFQEALGNAAIQTHGRIAQTASGASLFTISGLTYCSAIQDFAQTEFNPTSSFGQLLYSGDNVNPQTAGEYGFGSLGKNFGVSTQDLPPEHLYMLSLVVAQMRETQGGSFRYPCNPDDVDNGGGCMYCDFLPPLRDGVPVTDPIQSRGYVHLRCAYQPSIFIMKPMRALLSLVLGKESLNHPIVFHRAAIFQSVSGQSEFDNWPGCQ